MWFSVGINLRYAELLSFKEEPKSFLVLLDGFHERLSTIGMHILMKLFVSAKLFLVRYRLQTAQRLIQNDLLSFRFDGQGSPSPLGYVGQTWNLCLDPQWIMA